MDKQNTFFESILNYLASDTSGALMISGAWGLGKTYYINNVLNEKLEEQDYFPIKISLFGLSNVDGLERRVTEIFLQTYGEERLLPVAKQEERIVSKFAKLASKINLSKGTQSIQNIADFIPYLGQYIDVSRILDAYTNVCMHRLPKDKLVLIFDDLERAVKTIQPHMLLGVINNLMESSKYKVILIANDSYFNKEAEHYLDFKEKVIERTLIFQQDMNAVYTKLIGDNDKDFQQLMSDKAFFDVINPDAIINRKEIDLRENLNNIRILKFAISNYRILFTALRSRTNVDLEDPDFKNFLCSLWALTVGLSIEYKRNRLTNFDRDAYINASAIDSFVIDLGTDEINPFIDKESHEDESRSETSVGRVRSILKKYVERHKLPLIESVQVFDLITAGVFVKELLCDRWDKYLYSIQRQQGNPAEVLLNSFMLSIGSFTNEEFPIKLQQLAVSTENAELPNDVSYINAATYLQHYCEIIGKTQEQISQIIIKGIDKRYKTIVKLPVLSKTNLDVISTEIPATSRWVLDYLKKKIDQVSTKELQDDIQEAIRQFNEDLPTLVKRLAFNTSSYSAPDFFSFPILEKIPKNIIVDKMKHIQPIEIMAISSIIDSRFVHRNVNLPFDAELSFLSNINIGIQARKQKEKTLADFLIADHLLPIIDKVMPKDLPIDEEGKQVALSTIVVGETDEESIESNNTDIETE